MKSYTRVLDLFLSPFVYPSGRLLYAIRRFGVQHLPLCRKTLDAAGVFPVRDHYYEPLTNPKHLSARFGEPRDLPGIAWDLEGQRLWLQRLSRYAGELKAADLPSNTIFGQGDADYWYAFVRELKPKQIIEIGSGFSTKIARLAIERNGTPCEHSCIEPYEVPWLEETGATVIRKRVEEVDPAMFSRLSANDILFIDSSHVVRPEGDVLLEMLQIVPSLKPGVVVHFHDIFSPRNYPYDWVAEKVWLWNEQYLLEAFLTHNHEWEILGALNYLYHRLYDELSALCINLDRGENGPGSFYIRRK